jgi:EpsG family
MLPYLSIYVIASLLVLAARSRQQSILLAAMFSLFIALFAGTRIWVGCDYYGYMIRFQSIMSFPGWTDLLIAGESGFQGLSIFLKSNEFSYTALILVCSSIYALCLLRFSRLAQSPLALLLLCFPILVIQLGMSGMRQALATGFLMLSIASFIQGRRVWVALWILVAWQFHTSAIIFLPLTLLVGKNISALRIATALAVLGPVVILLAQDRFEVYSNRYILQTYGENTSSGAWLRYAVILACFAAFRWRYWAVKAQFPKYFEVLRLFMFIGIALLPMGFMSTVALHRMVFYVMPVAILAVLVSAETLRGTSRNLLLGGVVIAFGAYMFVWLSHSRHARICYIPYDSWLF